jgi:hypothetical protein
MKKLLSASLLIISISGLTALPNYDPFADATAGGGTAYTVGNPLSGNNQNVTNDWQLVNSNVVGTNPQPMIVTGNLVYPDLAPNSTGNSVSLSPPAAGSGGSARLNLRTTAPSLAYYSFILRVTDLTAVPTVNTANFIAAFSDTTGTQTGTLQRSGGKLVVKQSGGGYVLGIGKGTSTGDYAYDGTVRNIGDVVYVVVAYERTGGQTNVNLWVNPPAASFGAVSPPATSATIPAGSGAGDMNSSGLIAFVLACQSTAIPSCIIDEVRVATSWGMVTGGTPTFPVAISAQPTSRNVNSGDRVSFVVGSSGTSPAYQWRFNGTDIAGATNSYYTLSSADSTNVGSYRLFISNSVNSVTSSPAVLNVSTTGLKLYETNLVIIRVGDGAQILATSGNTVYLDQLTTNGTYVNTIFVPDSGSSALLVPGPDLNGSTLTGTALTRSMDGRFMTIGGYNVSLGNATALQNTTATAVPRAVVTVDSNGQVIMAVVNTSAYSSGFFRGAATDGTNNFWGAGSVGGTYYFGSSAAAGLVQTSFVNTRCVDIFNGSVYCVASQTGANGLIKLQGLQKTDQGAVLNILPGFNSVNTTDVAINSTENLVYIGVASTIQRWSFASSWVNDYAIDVPVQTRYLTADFSGAAPVLYVTTQDGGLYRIVDTGAASTAMLIASSGPNQLLKGVRLGPVPNTAVPSPTLAYSRSGTDLILSWTGVFTLQSATNVSGPYGDVVSVSPYTNSVTSAAQQFFRLRN